MNERYLVSGTTGLLGSEIVKFIKLNKGIVKTINRNDLSLNYDFSILSKK